MATRRIGNLNVNFTPTQNQTQLYNMLGRDTGLNYGTQGQQGNFWDNPIGNAWEGFKGNIANRARAAENAIGTTIAAPISFIDTARENANIDKRNAQHAKSLEDIYRNSGYNSSSDFWNAKNAAEQELFKKYGFDIDDYWNKREQLWNPDGGNSEELAKLDASREAIKSLMNDEERNRINRFDEIENQLRNQTAANADENRTAANNWRDYMQNSYIGKKINQDRGKFLGDAMTTVSTGADIAAMGMGLPMGIAANAIQGGVEGLANELSQNGFENFDWGRAGQNALIGAASGAATAGLNKVLPGAKAGGLVKNVASSTGRGALSGAVGGAVGGGLGAFMNGQDVLQGTLSGAGQGAVSGGVSGAAMGTVNALGNKVIGKGLERAQARQQAGQDATLGDKTFNKIREIQTTGQRWTDSGKDFNERLTNTLNSGESKVGNWINGRQQSKLLNSLGNVGDSIRDYTDQGMGIRKATDEAYKDLVRERYEDDRGGYEGALRDAKAAGYPNETNYQKALRFMKGGSMAVYPEDMLDSLRDVYGADFKESTYKNKDGSWKMKNGEKYVETMYNNQVAQRLAKDMDAMDAGTYQSAQNIQPKTSSLAKAREIYDDIDAQLSKKAQGLSGVAVSDEDILGNMRLQGYGDEADLIKLSRRTIPEGAMLSAEEVDTINRNTPDLSPEEQKIHNEVLADVKRTPVANGPDHTPDRLAYLRNQIENENISYSELAELQDYAPQILEMGDTELAQWAGIPEEQFVDYQNRAAQRQNPQWDYEWRKSGDEVSSVAGHSFKSPSSGKFVINGGRGYDGTWNFDTKNEVDSLYSGVEHAQLAQNNGKAVVQQVGPYNDNFAVVNSDTGEIMYNGIPYSYNNSLTQQEAAAFAEGYNAQIDARNNAVTKNLKITDIASKIPGEIEAMNNQPTQKLSRVDQQKARLQQLEQAYESEGLSNKEYSELKKLRARYVPGSVGYDDEQFRLFQNDVQKVQNKLSKQAPRENFGDSEIRNLRDKWSDYMSGNWNTTGRFQEGMRDLEDWANNWDYNQYTEANPNQSDSPTTLGGWVKKAGKRIIEDANNKGVGLSLRDTGKEYSDDIAGMKINRNDMLDDTVERPETELYRQLTGGSGNGGNDTPTPTPTPTGDTGDAWDNLAREFGYNTYNDAIRAFAAANPNTPISAGAVTTWLDSNEGNYNPNQVQITQNATMPTEIQEAEIVPSKTSKESKMRYAQGKELLAQYGSVDQPMARATNAPETFQKIAEMGFTKPADVEKISNAITGSNGAVSKLTKSIIASAKPVNTFDGATEGQTLDQFIDNSIEHNMLSGTNQGKAVKRGITAYLKALPSHADGSITMEDNAADAFKVVQGLEARAAELEGRGGSTYHRATTEDVHQAAVLKDVANLLKDRIYEGADVKSALTPQVAQELKAFDPNNKAWSKTIDNFVANAKTAADLRAFQKPFVRAARYIDNQYVQAATAGGRMAASAGELPAILPTTKAGIIKQVVNNVWNSNPAHRARAAAYGKLAENAAANAPQNQTTAQPATSNPQTQIYDLLNRNNTLNIVGRNLGEKTGEEQRPIDNYLQEASAESGYMPPLAATTSTAGTASSLEDLADTGTTTGASQTAISDTLTGAQGNPYAGQFSSTGDDQIDLIGRAVELAMEAGDAEAFGTLYQMYNSALASAQKQASGSDLSATQQTQLAKFGSAEDAINELETLYQQAGGGKGPIKGNLQSIAGDWGWDSGARTYNQMAEGLVNQIAQAIGKTDSLNTEGEVQRALKLVPSLTDDAQTAQNKLRTLREMLAQTKANYYGAYGV